MKFLKVIGFIILTIFSVLYSYSHPEKLPKVKKQTLYIHLEGAFNKTGKYPYKKDLTLKQIIDKEGTLSNANLKSININEKIKPEQTIYLPIQKEYSISLNHSSVNELKKLEGVGEKTALKIIQYRENKTFKWIEDIKNIQGIGEKRFIKYRDYLCL